MSRTGVSAKVNNSSKGSYLPALGGSKGMATANKEMGKNDKKKGEAVLTLDELDRIRA